MMVRHLYVVGNYLNHLYLQDVVHLVALQIQDEQNRDAVLTFLVVHRLHLRDVVVDEVLRHQLKMDCYLDVADEVRQLKMDCFLDVELQALHRLHLLHLHLYRHQLVQKLAQMVVKELAQLIRRELPLGLLNRLRVRRLIQQLTLDLLQRSFWQRSSSRLPS
jgi:hypothetical protein